MRRRRDPQSTNQGGITPTVLSVDEAHKWLGWLISSFAHQRHTGFFILYKPIAYDKTSTTSHTVVARNNGDDDGGADNHGTEVTRAMTKHRRLRDEKISETVTPLR